MKKSIGKAHERECDLVLKKMFDIYEENLNNTGLYDKLFWTLEKYKPFHLNKLKTELLAEEATKSASSLAISTSAMILSILAIIFNAFSKFSDLPIEWTITIVLVMIVAPIVLMCKFGSIFSDFIGERKKIWKRNKYILCVINDVLAREI